MAKLSGFDYIILVGHKLLGILLLPKWLWTHGPDICTSAAKSDFLKGVYWLSAHRPMGFYFVLANSHSGYRQVFSFPKRPAQCSQPYGFLLCGLPNHKNRLYCRQSWQCVWCRKVRHFHILSVLLHKFATFGLIQIMSSLWSPFDP